MWICFYSFFLSFVHFVCFVALVVLPVHIGEAACRSFSGAI